MGKKTKIGKRRKDKFYHLAKETGYRARSAFKLVQLNRKYHFLQSSRVLIDLCAAPGGWLQVAAKSMPISSLILGVDLVPIKPISGVITLQEDITTARCKQLLQKELKTWKVDCVLNDGAPNIGSAWVQDAFSQVELTLAALKLACAFLREGGWFITKVFRSKDYQPLMWVLQQLFKKVHATKPQASRIESAEIFVVCQGYLAPSEIDEKMLDPKHVFQEVEEEKTEEKVSLVKLQKPSKVAEGYPNDANVLFKTTPVADFVMSDCHLSILRESNQLIFDRASEVFSRHPLTNDEIRESCQDLKVLGPRELKQLVKWREKMRKFLEDVGSEEEGEKEEEGKVPERDESLDGIDGKVEALASKEKAEVKREIRRLRKQRKKLKERLVIKGTDEETGELIRQEHLFQLKDIKTKNQLENIVGDDVVEEVLDESDEDMPSAEVESCEEEESSNNEGYSSAGEESISGESAPDIADTECHDTLSARPEQPSDNPLLVSLNNSSSADVRLSKTKLWFSKSIFTDLENDQDEENELQQMVRSYKNKGGHLWTKEDSNFGDGMESRFSNKSENGCLSEKVGNSAQTKRVRFAVSIGRLESSDNTENDRTEVESDSNSAMVVEPDSNTVGIMESDFNTISANSVDKTWSSEDSSSEEEQSDTINDTPETQRDNKMEETSGKLVPVGNKKRMLDPEGLAIGALMVQSKKKREDLVESGYNRWTNNDPALPDWFLEDEAKFCQKRLPITKEMVEIYRAKLKEINARPIKKVAEAKARKKKRALKSLEKARKKAESIADAMDVSSHEKAQQIKQIYKKAASLGKKKKGNVEYVVAKKGVGKKVRRPAGVKGHFKVVDRRMKKDTRGKLASAKRQKGNRRKR